MPEDKKRLIIIDSNSVIHRAFHALPPLSTKDGRLVNAVYGFLLVFFKAIKDFNPEYVCACFDVKAPTFRHKKFKAYKAKRPPAPDELYQQIPEVKKTLEAFGIAIFEKEGFEADDLIGTIATLAQRKQVYPKMETIILSGDLDALQLVNPQTKVFALRKGVKDVVLYDEDAVKAKYGGLTPSQILDFKAMRGDASDNIPGITGIGEKTAISLLLRFKSLDNLYEKIRENSKAGKSLTPRLKEMIISYRDQAYLSRELARIETNVPLSFSLEGCHFKEYDEEKVTSTLKNFEFNSLLNKLPHSGPKELDKPEGENLKLW